jgi:hypothetical protein
MTREVIGIPLGAISRVTIARGAIGCFAQVKEQKMSLSPDSVRQYAVWRLLAAERRVRLDPQRAHRWQCAGHE